MADNSDKNRLEKLSDRFNRFFMHPKDPKHKSEANTVKDALEDNPLFDIDYGLGDVDIRPDDKEFKSFKEKLMKQVPSIQSIEILPREKDALSNDSSILIKGKPKI